MVISDEARPAPRARLGAMAGPLLGDLVAPIVVYYVAESLGAPLALALALGGLTALPRQLLELARHRRLDGMGTTVLVAFALGSVELALAMSVPINAAAAVPGLVSLVALPVLVGGTALYAKRTGLGVRRSLAEMGLDAEGDAR